jgi:hypothetical protein
MHQHKIVKYLSSNMDCGVKKVNSLHFLCALQHELIFFHKKCEHTMNTGRVYDSSTCVYRGLESQTQTKSDNLFIQISFYARFPGILKMFHDAIYPDQLPQAYNDSTLHN